MMRLLFYVNGFLEFNFRIVELFEREEEGFWVSGRNRGGGKEYGEEIKWDIWKERECGEWRSVGWDKEDALDKELNATVNFEWHAPFIDGDGSRVAVRYGMFWLLDRECSDWRRTFSNSQKLMIMSWFLRIVSDSARARYIMR
jgi:hypothetical protein